MIQPNFFIAGAVRSGTTAMYTYLDEHLKVFMGRPKDGNFFSEDFDGLRTVTTWADYNRMFKDAQPEHRAVGEASALYLHSDVACAAIREYRPGAKIIVLLREPARLVESLHAQMYYTGDEDEVDFEAAWRLQEERAEGGRMPPRCRAPKQLQYRQMGMLGQHVERLLDVFPREQIHIALFDDFRKTPRQVYENVLKFLDVPSDNRTDFPVINPRKRHKRRSVANVTEQPPSALRWAARWAKRIVPVKEFGLLDWIRRRNVSGYEPKPLRAEFKRELRAAFEEDTRRLANLIGRDLSHWLREQKTMGDK